VPPDESESETDVVPASLRGEPAWLFPVNDCPADVAAAVEQPTKYLSEACVPDLEVCLERCRGVEANGCYAAALRLQELEVDERYSEALFLRACRLGNRSGCTNHAAWILMQKPHDAEALACATRTFERMCASEDPWACTMFGNSLLRGLGTSRDPKRALEVLPQGCRLGPDDAACQAAQKLMEEIEAQLENGGD
jgi:TPR repeat protein